jgi:hypothetical protein
MKTNLLIGACLLRVISGAEAVPVTLDIRNELSEQPTDSLDVPVFVSYGTLTRHITLGREVDYTRLVRTGR